MKFQTYTGITWSDLELTGLIEDELSLVRFERFKKHLGLHPFHLTNLNAALNEILSSNLNSYDKELKGFLLAYKNPKLLTPLGEILYDTCFIHVDIEADFYIFRPEVGCSLKGTVNKKGLDHIGLLVHKAFNVSIPKQDDDEDWPGDDLAIGQDVRFVVTCLDITSGLPYIRGALNANEYSQAKLRRQEQNKTSSFDNKPVKQQSFFPTDSEHSSNEDEPQALKETPKQKRSKKKYEPEEVIEHHETKKEGKKRTKKAKEVKESKPKLITTESEQERYANNVSTNGKFQNNLEEAVTPKKRARKKSIDHSSQSSVDEYDNEKYSQKKALKALSHMGSRHEKSDVQVKYCPSNSDSDSRKGSNKLPILESNDNISNIKFEQSMANSDLEQSESKIKSKKKSTKRKHLDDDTSADDFTADKYIKNANKKSRRKSKMVDTETEEVSIKTENLNDLYIDEVNIVAESPSKKKQKIHNSLKLETSESEVDKQRTEKASTKRRSKESSISECEFTIGSIKVKTERFSGSENTQDEDHEKTNKLTQIKWNSKAPANSSNCDVEKESEDNTVKKKRKKHSKKSLIDTSEIKIEPEFEVIVKKEKSDNATENISPKSPPKTTSPKKKRKVELGEDITNETDQENVAHLKKNKVTDKNTKTHDVNIKTEKSITNHALDEDMSDANKRHNGKEKNRSKSVSKKHLNKSREFLSDTDFSDVEIKYETSVNS
ncbi:RNA polymerase I subunit F [Andrena cerasifolii]|uniref:RNA polymerase I subunit F n=1 Tax=Andrena cerasifolii TaxID=2819439 RepID=UPI004037F834